ncbi:hypothetical protein C8Q73DRAFT_770713 [Cubamyces lactineus]|nr:hypothetical protein C8Q73DRAFT_770713 [Cubamyces lactineus]
MPEDTRKSGEELHEHIEAGCPALQNSLNDSRCVRNGSPRKIYQIKPHGAVYDMTARDPALARAAVGVAKTFNVPFMGLPGTHHQAAAKELGVPFIAEWFVDMEYSPEGKLLITKTHEPLSASVVRDGLNRLLEENRITTTTGSLPLTEGVTEVSICCHSDTPGAVEIAEAVKALVDRNNAQLQ